jgi:hypothetical protein
VIVSNVTIESWQSPKYDTSTFATAYDALNEIGGDIKLSTAAHRRTLSVRLSRGNDSLDALRKHLRAQAGGVVPHVIERIEIRESHRVIFAQNGSHFFASAIPASVTAVPVRLSFVSRAIDFRWIGPASVTFLFDKFNPVRPTSLPSAGISASVSFVSARLT